MTAPGILPPDAEERVGFFTDSSICIGCKACEVACKEWNLVPVGSAEHDALSGNSYDNTGKLGADTWRHVTFLERGPAGRGGAPPVLPDGPVPGTVPEIRWLMSSDVCKHCTEAACLEVCPTGALFRTEFGTVVVQPDVCNGCGYCVPACPFGVIEQRPDDGRVWKCTLCYDRLRDDMTPACAQACPTESIHFGPLVELRREAQDRVDELHRAGVAEAYLYGADDHDGVGGMGAFFLLLDQPEAYGLPPDPVTTTRDVRAMWRSAATAAGALAGVIGALAVRAAIGRPR